MTATLAALVRQAADRLRPALSTEQNVALDAEVLARHVLGWSRERWIADSRNVPPPGFEAVFEGLLRRRANGEPIAYITRTREFWELDFEVSPAVLIPRPETEILVEQALKAIADPGGSRHTRVADVGTGSGCIAIALARSAPSIHLVATDISRAALDVARRNARRHGVAHRIDFVQTPGLEGVGEIDLVVSNPPYIGEADAPALMRDVVDYEPHTALFSGGDGLGVIRAILDDVARRRPVPPLLFEFGGNEPAIRQAVHAAGLRLVEIIPDLAGIPRVARVEA